MKSEKGYKLNLGCGSKLLDGYINVDKYDVFQPDVVHDLEQFPYPFESSTVVEIVLNHVLEHLGHTPEIFNQIIREFYRICRNGAIVDITVPHPRHSDFISDPTHVRAITVLGLQLYDRKLNDQWQQDGSANSQLAIIHNVNFKIESTSVVLEQKYIRLLREKRITREEIVEFAEQYNNVIRELRIKWEVVK